MFKMERDVWKFAVLMVIVGFIGVWYLDAYVQAGTVNYDSEVRSPVNPPSVLDQFKNL
jgi:hypothetical protein